MWDFSRLFFSRVKNKIQTSGYERYNKSLWCFMKRKREIHMGCGCLCLCTQLQSGIKWNRAKVVNASRIKSKWIQMTKEERTLFRDREDTVFAVVWTNAFPTYIIIYIYLNALMRRMMIATVTAKMTTTSMATTTMMVLFSEAKI